MLPRTCPTPKPLHKCQLLAAEANPACFFEQISALSVPLCIQPFLLSYPEALFGKVERSVPTTHARIDLIVCRTLYVEHARHTA